MTAILTNRTTSGSSANQTAQGPVVVAISGRFAGATVVVETNIDNLGWAPAHTAKAPGTWVLDFAPGQVWRATVIARDNEPSISVAALPKE